MTIWRHPELGKFTRIEYGWNASVSAPAFRTFQYLSNGRDKKAKLELTFETDDSDKPPSKSAASIATRVLKNQTLLVSRIKTALWKDLHGQGENSGMWWHGDLKSIREAIASSSGDKKPLPFSEPDDLDALIGCPSILVQESIYLYEKPVATIKFEAAFDEEHGLGVLTDGNRVLGIGYQMDAGPFFKEQVKGKKKRK